jgi:hypothetical protein
MTSIAWLFWLLWYGPGRDCISSDLAWDEFDPGCNERIQGEL